MVAHQPEGHAVGVGEVFADAADVNIVATGQEEGHGIFALGGIVAQREAFAIRHGAAHLFDGEGALGLHPNGFGVAAHHRNADASGAHFDVGVHDLARFVVHLHLFLRISVVGEDIDLGNDVVSQLIGEFLNVRLFAGRECAVLGLEFVHGSLACAGGCLVTGHVHAADVAQLLDGLERHHHHNRGAIGIGNDATGAVEGICGVALGHHEGHVLIHAEGAGIVDHHGTETGDVCRKFARDAGAGAGEGDVDAAKIVGVVAQFANCYVAIAETIDFAGTTFRTEESKFVDGKLAFGQYAEKLLAHGTAGAYNGYVHRMEK